MSKVNCKEDWVDNLVNGGDVGHLGQKCWKRWAGGRNSQVAGMVTGC